jgi:hypothetical protein
MFAKRICLSLVVAAILSISAQAINHPSNVANVANDGEAGGKRRVETRDTQGSGMLDILKRADNALEGTWIVTVNLVAPPPGFSSSFTALETYSRGGGLVTSNNLPPVPRPGQGAWKRNGNRFEVIVRFFLFDQNGAPAGSVIVEHEISLEGKNEYAGAGNARFLDPNGNLLTEVAFTTQGERVTL